MSQVVKDEKVFLYHKNPASEAPTVSKAQSRTSEFLLGTKYWWNSSLAPYKELAIIEKKTTFLMGLRGLLGWDWAQHIRRQSTAYSMVWMGLSIWGIGI